MPGKYVGVSNIKLRVSRIEERLQTAINRVKDINHIKKLHEAGFAPSLRAANSIQFCKKVKCGSKALPERPT